MIKPQMKLEVTTAQMMNLVEFALNILEFHSPKKVTSVWISGTTGDFVIILDPGEQQDEQVVLEPEEEVSIDGSEKV